MKTIAIHGLPLLCVAALCSGCATGMTLHAAKGDHSGMLDEAIRHGPYREPGYFALLPLTVPLDIGTSPLQGLVFLMWQHNPFDLYYR